MSTPVVDRERTEMLYEWAAYDAARIKDDMEQLEEDKNIYTAVRYAEMKTFYCQELDEAEREMARLTPLLAVQ